MSHRRFALNGEIRLMDDSLRQSIPGTFIKLPDGFTWYELAGPANGRPVIFINGFSVPHYLWDHNFKPLADAGLRVLRFDHFGRGWSDRPDLDYSPDLFDRQIIDLIHSLDINTPVSLVGSSMGGIVASIFAVRHPELVDRLVLLDPAGVMPPPEFPKSLLLVPVLGELIMHLTGSRTLPSGMAEDLLYPDRFPQYVSDYLPQMEIAGFKRAVLSTFRSGILWNERAVYEQLGKLDIPVLLVWGEHDQTVPLACGEEILKMLPRAEWWVIDDTGHVPHYEHADVLNPMMVEFLNG